jgi:hypothetical protein
MIRFLKACNIVAVTLFISACATGPKYHTMKESIPALAPGKGRIYFYRSNSFVGAGVQPSIKLNNQVVGKSKPGGFFFVDRSPGDIEISTATEVEKKLTFKLEDKQTRYVKTYISIGLLLGRVYPELVDNETGEKEIAESSYIGEAPNAINTSHHAPQP